MHELADAADDLSPVFKDLTHDALLIIFYVLDRENCAIFILDIHGFVCGIFKHFC